MRLVPLAMLSAVALLLVPHDGAAQVGEEQQQAYWYVSHFKIPFAKVDSLVSLEKSYSPRIRAGLTSEQSGMLDRKVLIHDTGNEWTVVIMTKHPSWASIRAEPPVNMMQHVFRDEAERGRIQAAFNWVFEGAEHWDAIYREAEEISN
jgi:hypothetical protein